MQNLAWKPRNCHKARPKGRSHDECGLPLSPKPETLNPVFRRDLDLEIQDCSGALKCIFNDSSSGVWSLMFCSSLDFDDFPEFLRVLGFMVQGSGFSDTGFVA